VFESLLFLLTMVKFYAALREGWGREPIISCFMRDGIWAFALPFGMSLPIFAKILTNCPWGFSKKKKSFINGKHTLYDTFG
jgi:hypothetical protein